jgi:hypothetical protein
MRSLLAMSLLLMPVAAPLAVAQDKPAVDAPVQDQAPQRIRNVALRAGEKCPASNASEIVVCSTIEEPYRIPRRLRESPPTAANRSWVTRSETVDDLGRAAGGLPDTCSPTGTGGQTGCTQALLKQWTAEQHAKAQGTQLP